MVSMNRWCLDVPIEIQAVELIYCLFILSQNLRSSVTLQFFQTPSFVQIHLTAKFIIFDQNLMFSCSFTQSISFRFVQDCHNKEFASVMAVQVMIIIDGVLYSIGLLFELLHLIWHTNVLNQIINSQRFKIFAKLTCDYNVTKQKAHDFILYNGNSVNGIKDG